MQLPKKLTRRAIIQEFTKISEGRWEYLFEHEKENGISEFRVDGHFSKAYYLTDGIVDWLLTEAIYRRSDFDDAIVSNSPWSKTIVRKHVLFG